VVNAEAVNWAGNVTFTAGRVHRPATVEQVRSLVAGAARVRALGTRHSFSEVADSPGDLISLAGLPPEVEVDTAARSARVAAGMRYADVTARLEARGLALPNLASLGHVSVGGACATSTHGSGDGNGSLATAVSALELVTADGDLVTLRHGEDGEDGEDGGDGGALAGAVVGLGVLGVVVSLTLDLVPAFSIRQHVWEGLPLAVLDEHFPEVAASAYSVSMFTRWEDDPVLQVWFKQRAGQPAPAVTGEPWFRATPASGPRHPVPGFPPEYCTAQLGESGPSSQRLPHFRPDALPSAGSELQTEYLIDRRDAAPALRALAAVRDRIQPVLRVSEIRTVAADGLWLSPSYQRDSVAIHFTWIPDTAAVLDAVRLIEERLAPFGPRPHWGKVFTIPPAELAPRYEKLGSFRELARRHDPAGKFANAFTARYLGIA
jgi:alditol oxidase